MVTMVSRRLASRGAVRLNQQATRAAAISNALLQSMCFRTDATELGPQWRTAEMRNALLQSMCFTTDASELGGLGAVRPPFEELAPCDGGRGGPRHQRTVLTKSTHCYSACVSGPMLQGSVLNGAQPT
jgi:hypothetical protein